MNADTGAISLLLIYYYLLYRHFASIIVEEMPEVVLLQEVRLDGSFTPKMPDAASGGNDKKKAEVGSQVEHLLQAIKNSIHSTYTNESDVQIGSELYQVVYQPAMLLQEL